MSTMAFRIRRARTMAALTQAEVARRLGVSRSAVTQWERSNGTAPSVEHLARIACETNVSFEWLTTGRGPASPGEIPDTGVIIEDIAGDQYESQALRAMRRLSRRNKKVAAAIIDLLSQA